MFVVLQKKEYIFNPHYDVHFDPQQKRVLTSFSSQYRSPDVDNPSADSKVKDPFVFTVTVGMKPSSAHYYLNNENEVLSLLEALTRSPAVPSLEASSETSAADPSSASSAS